MVRIKSAGFALLAVLLLTGPRSLAQETLNPGPQPQAPPAPATTGAIQLNGPAIGPQSSPQVNVSNSSVKPFEQNDSLLSLPSYFARTWSLTKDVPSESLISERYLRSADNQARTITLKEAIYIALRNNPQIAAASLSPVAAVESVTGAHAAFDPNLTAQLDQIKSVTPTSSILTTGGSDTSVNKLYDWDFGINKVSSITNGTFGITFNNERAASNSLFASVNPSYTSGLTMSVSQPLLQSFGWDFATINIRIAESGQLQQQWTYGQSLQDFVQRIGNEYWAVVLAEENLEVARAALVFNQDLVRQNAISLKVGTLAPLDLQEAQSAEATAEANVYTAEANLESSRAQLRQDVMFNPSETFLPADLEPATRPNPTQVIEENEERALELAVQYLPSLAGMREAIRDALLQVKFSENQSLPQLNIGAQFGVNAEAGTTPCGVSLSASNPLNNCFTPESSNPPPNGIKLPFGGIYGDALNRLWGFSFYNYAGVLTFQLPLDNAAARAQLASARILFDQQRLNYRAALSQAIVNVQQAIYNVYADQRRAAATASATYYAREALRDEQIRFRVGMATTHDLLQFQEEEVSAEGNEVQANIDLENAKLALRHSEGTLLREFSIDWQIQTPKQSHWYSAF